MSGICLGNIINFAFQVLTFLQPTSPTNPILQHNPDKAIYQPSSTAAPRQTLNNARGYMFPYGELKHLPALGDPVAPPVAASDMGGIVNNAIGSAAFLGSCWTGVQAAGQCKSSTGCCQRLSSAFARVHMQPACSCDIWAQSAAQHLMHYCNYDDSRELCSHTLLSGTFMHHDNLMCVVCLFHSCRCAEASCSFMQQLTRAAPCLYAAVLLSGTSAPPGAAAVKYNNPSMYSMRYTHAGEVMAMLLQLGINILPTDIWAWYLQYAGRSELSNSYATYVKGYEGAYEARLPYIRESTNSWLVVDFRQSMLSWWVMFCALCAAELCWNIALCAACVRGYLCACA